MVVTDISPVLPFAEAIIKVHPWECQGHRHVSMWSASNLNYSLRVLGPQSDRTDLITDLSQQRTYKLSWRKGAHTKIKAWRSWASWECPQPNLRPRGTRKSLNKPYTRSNWIPNTPRVLVSKDQKLGRLGRAGWDVLESLGCPVWLSQPQSIWDRSLLAEWKFWLHKAPSDLRSAPLLTAGKFIFGDFPTSLTLPLQRVRSHPVIMTLVLKQLFILFHLGLVAHTHWWRALPQIPPPAPFLTVQRLLAFVGGDCIRRRAGGWGGEKTQGLSAEFQPRT